MTQLPALLTTREVADLLRVHHATVRNWAASGRVEAISLPGGTYRFKREVVERLIGTAAPEPVSA